MREGVRVDTGSVVGILEQEGASAATGEQAATDEGESLSNPGRLPAGAVALFMPALSSTMTQGTITKWHKEEGDKIEASATNKNRIDLKTEPRKFPR